MNKKSYKFSGYSSVILIIFISILAITISYISIAQYQNSLLLRNNLDSLQSKYISESYFNYVISEIKDSNSIDNIHIKENLFPDLDHEFYIKEKNLIYDKIPSLEIKVENKYADMVSNVEGIISIYNKIFYLEKGFINSNNLTENENVYLDIFKNSIKSGVNYSKEYNIINPTEDIIIASTRFPALYRFNNEEFVRLENLTTSNYIFDNKTYFGFPDETSGNVSLTGTFYIEESLELLTNVTLNGIVISDNGQINTNGYSCKINGILIELNENGSYANVDITYNRVYVNGYIDFITNTTYYELLSKVIND